MTIEAHMADGRILEFPDGTSKAVIEATAKRLIAEKLPKIQLMLLQLQSTEIP